MPKPREPNVERRRLPPFALPPNTNLADVAVDLFMWTNSASHALAAGDVQVARGGWADTPGVRATMEELRRSAEISGSIYWLMRDLIPHEAEFRQFLADLAERDRRLKLNLKVVSNG